MLKDAVPELPVFAHFAGLFESGEHADVILRMCGVEIKAHRAILVARAAFFARQAAFEELQEKSPIPVMSLECEGVDADDFRAVIRSLCVVGFLLFVAVILLFACRRH